MWTARTSLPPHKCLKWTPRWTMPKTRLLVKKIGQWELSLETKRSSRALQRFPKFSEPRAGGASIPLKRHCSLTTCLLLGSYCPAHALPSVSADCSEPTQEGRSPACRVASRRGRPGDLCMTPRICCLSVLARGFPECLAGRIDRPDTLLALLGSWCAGPTPLRTIGRRLVCPRTALPNAFWKRLSWQPSFCAPCLGSLLALARRDPSNGPGLIHRPESPSCGGIRDARPWMEPSASARTGWVACEADPTEVPAKPLP